VKELLVPASRLAEALMEAETLPTLEISEAGDSCH